MYNCCGVACVMSIKGIWIYMDERVMTAAWHIETFKAMETCMRSLQRCRTRHEIENPWLEHARDDHGNNYAWTMGFFGNFKQRCMGQWWRCRTRLKHGYHMAAWIFQIPKNKCIELYNPCSHVMCIQTTHGYKWHISHPFSCRLQMYTFKWHG